MFLRKRQKAIAKEAAEAAWEWSKDRGWTPEQRYNAAKLDTETYITGLRYSKECGGGRDGFGSVITSIIISLMIKFAVSILLKKLEDAIFSETESVAH